MINKKLQSEKPIANSEKETKNTENCESSLFSDCKR